MDDHFRAFSFVDRIDAIHPDGRVSGSFEIPAGIDGFASSLVAEAVGQLAAWASMAALGFRVRPVAGLAGTIEIFGAAAPGSRLDLTAQIESADDDAVAYGGAASIAGMPVVRLHHCIGPMMPLDDFDDPAAVRARFEVLRNGGAACGGFDGVPQPVLIRGDADPRRRHTATLAVPAGARFFADHFPRRPVFPGTLLMDANLRIAAELAATVPTAAGQPWRLASVHDVKVRTFTPPGATLAIEAFVVTRETTGLVVVVESRAGNRTVSSARVNFQPETTA